jgi:hypothetical protein
MELKTKKELTENIKKAAQKALKRFKNFRKAIAFF